MQAGNVIVEQIVGELDPTKGAFVFNESDIVFRAGTGMQNMPNYVNVPAQDFNYLPAWARAIAIAEFALAEILSLTCVVVTIMTRTNKIMVNAQPVLLIIIAMGCGITAAAILGLSMDDNPQFGYTVGTASTACMSIPSLFTFGLSVTLIALSGKMYRIWSIFDNRKLRKVKVTLYKVLAIVAFFICSMLLLVVVWIATEPLYWQRIVDQVDANGYPVSSHGECTGSDVSIVFLGLVFGITAIVVVASCVIAYYIRSFPSQFQESKYVGLIVMSIGQIYVVALPSAVAVYNSAIGRFIILTSVVFITVCVIQFLLFFPKIYLIIKGKPWWPSNSSSSSPANANVVAQKEQHHSHSAVHVDDNHPFFSGQGTKLSPTNSFRYSARSKAPAAAVDSADARTVKNNKHEPHSASLEAVTGGALHNRGAQFYQAMKDKALRAILFSRLRKNYKSEGLEFFTCVLDRNRLESEDECAAATRTIMREFVLNDAKRQVNIASEARDHLIRACMEEDNTQMMAPDFFAIPALESCKEIIASRDFAEFVREFIEPLEARPVPESIAETNDTGGIVVHLTGDLSRRAPVGRR